MAAIFGTGAKTLSFTGGTNNAGGLTAEAIDGNIARVAAVGTEFVVCGRLECLRDRHAMIEHETFPRELAVRELLQVGEDPALQLIDVVVPLLLHRQQRLFAAAAAGAVHEDFFVFRQCAGFCVVVEVLKMPQVGIDSPSKHPQLRLVVVARIEDDDILREHLLPLLRRQMTVQTVGGSIGPP